VYIYTIIMSHISRKKCEYSITPINIGYYYIIPIEKCNNLSNVVEKP